MVPLKSISFMPIRVIGTSREIMDMVLDYTMIQENFTESANFTVAEVLVNPEFDNISKNNVAILSTDETVLDAMVLLYQPNFAKRQHKKTELYNH